MKDPDHTCECRPFNPGDPRNASDLEIRRRGYVVTHERIHDPWTVLRMLVCDDCAEDFRTEGRTLTPE